MSPEGFSPGKNRRESGHHNPKVNRREAAFPQK
jgi:hypothetical protein